MPENNNGTQSNQEISPELVRKVADEVYKMLLEQARIDYERRRRPLRLDAGKKGGR